MATQNENKLKKFMGQHKTGAVYLASWLEKQGISRDLQQYYVRSQWLETLGRGAYKKVGDEVAWENALQALQEQADLDAHVGGGTALEIQGYGHFVSMGRKRIHLYSPLGGSLPSWFLKHDWDAQVEHVRTGFLNSKAGLKKIDIKASQITISVPERAMFECLYLAPKHQDLVEANYLMEGLVNLRPNVVRELLENCSSVKVKRLFLYLATKANHQWLQHVDLDHINIGSGDRSITHNGVYVSKFGITVPRELESSD